MASVALIVLHIVMYPGRDTGTACAPPGRLHAWWGAKPTTVHFVLPEGTVSTRFLLRKSPHVIETKPLPTEPSNVLRFTMDQDLSNAVSEAFVRLHEKGLIYRGEYMVNWAPLLQTAVSDLEVEYTEEEGKLYFFKYMVKGSDDGKSS